MAPFSKPLNPIQDWKGVCLYSYFPGGVLIRSHSVLLRYELIFGFKMIGTMIYWYQVLIVFLFLGDIPAMNNPESWNELATYQTQDTHQFLHRQDMYGLFYTSILHCQWDSQFYLRWWAQVGCMNFLDRNWKHFPPFFWELQMLATSYIFDYSS